MFLTILTPTYNRGAQLKRLYNSLARQTCNDFEWLIVDDGSTDNTKEVVDSFSISASFQIRYMHKSNGGKHTALNAGIKSISSEMTFIVDSDDLLTLDAVEVVKKYGSIYIKNPEICGLSFLRQFPDGSINGKLFKRNELIGSYIDIRVNGDDMSSDKAEVFFTRCLKEFPFPVFKGEKFLGEDSVWVPMARKYKMVHINKAIYVGDYQNDGLTKNRRNNNIMSPEGCTYRANQYLFNDINIKFREKCALQYLIYGWFAGETTKELISSANQPTLVRANIIPARLIYEKWKKNYSKEV